MLLPRLFVQSRGLHLFPKYRAGATLGLVRFFLLYVKQVLFQPSKQLQYSPGFIFHLNRARTGTCMFCMPNTFSF